MDGAKSVTEMYGIPQGCGRKAFRAGRTWLERATGPLGNENPGVSRIIEL